MSIHVVGGVYHEYCVRPAWDNLYGSAGRAAIAIARMGVAANLHSYFTKEGAEQFRADFILQSNLLITQTAASDVARFWYLHDSAEPKIFNSTGVVEHRLIIEEDKVVRFGILDGDHVVKANWAVYDPQRMGATTSFRDNGSTANHLALVMNVEEARVMANSPCGTPEDCAKLLASQHDAEVVVIKMGPIGALLWTNDTTKRLPAYWTSNVWKIGSGDCFAAYFSLAWMHDQLTPEKAVEFASKATAYYCERMTLPSREDLDGFAPEPVRTSPQFQQGVKRQIYLAGPFFDLSQVWMIEEARRKLAEGGLKVFSPFHDIGLGAAHQVVQQDLEAIKDSDLVFAIADGLDSGTLYEIGYARALGKPVVIYSERESDDDLKMAAGSACAICRNFTTALYTTFWKAAEL